jgi:hypothetical protein
VKSEAQWIVIFFGVLICDMSLASPYFEAKEKKARLNPTIVDLEPRQHPQKPDFV